MENSYSVLMICLFPLLGGMIAFFLGKKNKIVRNDWVDIVMFAEWIMLGCAGYMLANGSVMSMTLNNLFGMGLVLEMNMVRLVLCAVVTIAFSVVSQFMKESMKEEKGSNRFYLLFTSVYSMLLAAVMTPNILNLVLFVTAALLLIYPMIMHRQDRVAVRNAGIYLVFVMISVALFMVGLVMTIGYIGTIRFDIMYMTAMAGGLTTLAVVAGAVLFTVFAVYAGVFPMQFLVTRGASNGLMEGTVILSSVVSKIGVYGMLMMVVTLFNSNRVFGNVLLGFALLTTVWGLTLALSSTDVRKILMGLNVAVNGFNALGVALIPIAKEANVYAARGSVYMLISSALSLAILYMVALELVRKGQTFEIKGLIASGKGKKLLMVACLIACANLLGFPGTMGYLSFSFIFKNIFTTVGWKWFIAMYVILWAFLMTSVSRVFMKFFVSKKEETVLILSTAEEISGANTEDSDDALEKDVEADVEESGIAQVKKDPYVFGEALLIAVGVFLVVIGIAPSYTVGELAKVVDEFFWIANSLESVAYYTKEGLVAFVIAAVLAILIYVNLVHGVLLRAVRNKKNKELKEKME